MLFCLVQIPVVGRANTSSCGCIGPSRTSPSRESTCRALTVARAPVWYSREETIYCSARRSTSATFSGSIWKFCRKVSHKPHYRPHMVRGGGCEYCEKCAKVVGGNTCIKRLSTCAALCCAMRCLASIAGVSQLLSASEPLQRRMGTWKYIAVPKNFNQILSAVIWWSFRNCKKFRVGDLLSFHFRKPVLDRPNKWFVFIDRTSLIKSYSL